MQDRLREIEGTLARTKERKNTILYKLAKRRQEEERLAALGVQKLPTNPYEVEDTKVVKYVLFRLKQEIGDKVAHLRDAKVLSIDKDGEAVVRAKNDEVNKLVIRKNQWEARLAALSGSEAPPYSKRKIFFGCAKNLPEAEATHKRPREESEAVSETAQLSSSSDADEPDVVPEMPEDDEGPQDSDYMTRVSWLGSAAADSELLQEERDAEMKLRASMGPISASSGSGLLVKSYCKDGVACIPSEEEFKAVLINKRKEALQERLKALRNKN